jgi:hypothetical protein
MRLFHFLRARAAASSPGEDAADMGTAWGMEMSFDPPPEALEPAPALPALQRGWLRRLAARRQAAG